MKSQLKFYKIDMKYVRDLAKKDDNVMSISPQLDKDMRPFVGVLVLVNGKQYCVPLSSPKENFKTKKLLILLKYLMKRKRIRVVNMNYQVLRFLTYANISSVTQMK